MNWTERYRFVRTVAAGGMAQVVEAVACGLNGFERRVAIKRLLPQYARDRERRRMFLQEARIGSRLYHGGIVLIFDYGLIDGAEFLAMEFVDGVDALRAASSGAAEHSPMPEEIALHITAEVAHALAYIHDLRDRDDKPLNIVHRDVSPANILLSWSGDVKLSDFGIAILGDRRETTEDLALEQEVALGGVVKGKRRYMAPEQARGETVGPAADVYGLGATLAALLGAESQGGSTIEGEAAACVAKAVSRGVSLAVCALIDECMAHDPARRPSAADVASRAGEMARQHRGRDGRGALRAWLAPLQARVRAQDAVDDLMGLSVVPVAGEGEGERSFTITQKLPKDGANLPEHANAPARRGVHAVSPASRRRFWLAAAATMVVLSLPADLGAEASSAPTVFRGEESELEEIEKSWREREPVLKN